MLFFATGRPRAILLPSGWPVWALGPALRRLSPLRGRAASTAVGTRRLSKRSSIGALSSSLSSSLPPRMAAVPNVDRREEVPI